MREIKTEKRIDAANAPKLDAELKAILAGGETELIVDMEETIYITSIGLRAFVSAQKKIKAVNGSMRLVNVTSQIMEIFEVTGFGGVLNFE